LCTGEDLPPSSGDIDEGCLWEIQIDEGCLWEIQTDEGWVPYWNSQV
jgi:hypothetical protein